MQTHANAAGSAGRPSEANTVRAIAMARPWQDFKALVGLRDQLVHFKWDGDDVPAFMRALQARDLTIPDDPAVYWVDAALTDRVAVWATATCERMFAALASLIGRTDPFDWPWQ